MVRRIWILPIIYRNNRIDDRSYRVADDEIPAQELISAFGYSSGAENDQMENE